MFHLAKKGKEVLLSQKYQHTRMDLAAYLVMQR